MTPSLILLRGLPGSGKTTLAIVLSDDGKTPVFSVDDYFTDSNGDYHFNYSENHLAYKQCQNNAESAMKDRVQKIIVDNTFTLEWELEPYFKMAGFHGYRVFVLTVENRHGGSNSHGISQEQIEKMAAKYQVKLF